MAPVSLILWALRVMALLFCTAAAAAEPHSGAPLHAAPSPRQRSQEDLLRLHQDLQRQRLQRMEYHRHQQRQDPSRPTPLDSWGIGR